MNFFLKLNFQLYFSQLLIDIKNDKFEWVKHGHNMPTCILSEIYQQEINKIINIEKNTKIYIHNLLPLKSLAKEEIPVLTTWHTDSHRKSAILIQISEDNINHYAEFRKGDVVQRAPYTQEIGRAHV